MAWTLRFEPFENIGIDAQVDRFLVAGHDQFRFRPVEIVVPVFDCHALDLFFGESVDTRPVGQTFMQSFAEFDYCNPFVRIAALVGPR